MTPIPPDRTLRPRQAGLFLVRALLVLVFVLALPSASAHAVLQSADPPVNGHVAVGVSVIEYRFTEDVERDYTSADLFDTQGESFAAGPIEFDAEKGNVIRLPVTPLADGIYEATWRALSVDTHTTRGTFVFAVGNATLAPNAFQPTVDVQDDATTARDGFARFAFYVGLFLVLGMPLCAFAVLREPQPPRGLFATAASFGLVGASGALVALLFLEDRTGLGMGVLETKPGFSYVLRGGFVLAGALACAYAAARPAYWRLGAALAVAFGAAAVLATSLGSHAAALRENAPLYVVADALHLAMGATWIGGIAALLHAAWGRSALDVGTFVLRFSPIAIGSVVVLLATGTLASLAHMPCASVWSGGVPCLDELRTENYVRLVALKILLMAPLILLGAFNKYRVGPRLARGVWTPRVFVRVLQFEAVVMAVVLGAAGMLAASAPPASDVEQADFVPMTFEVSNFTKTSHVILQISPNPVTVGVQKMVVAIHPLDRALENSTQVAVKVYPASEREPEITLDLEKVTPNEWERSDGFFTRAGEWKVTVLVQRPDEFAKLTFNVTVAPPGGTPSTS